MIRLLPIAILVLFLGFPVRAENEFQSWMQGQTTSFMTYKDERDREFVGFLKKQWKEFEMSKGLVRDEVPKPVDLPVAPVQPVRQILPSDKKIKIPALVPEVPPDLKKPVVTKPSPDILKTKNQLNFLFYQTPISIYVDPGFKMERPGKITRESIASFWEKMSHTDS